MTRSILLALLLALSAFVVWPTRDAGAQDPPLEPPLTAVLMHGADYVARFVEQLGGIVSEERYEQEVIPAPTLGGGASMRGRSPALGFITRQHRELKSDLLLVHPIGSTGWVQFRDVFEVDGSGVRDRNDRLAKLFLKPPTSLSAQLAEIARESARYNLGNLERTINMPLLPLVFLDPDTQSRFEFTRVVGPARSGPQGSATPQGMPQASSFAVPADAWEIHYKEVETGTLVRTTAERDLPAHGRFWIDPATGRVLMTELLLDDPFVRASVDVAYQLDSKLGFLVPAEMRESYVLRATGIRIEGTAKYSRFRKFQVTVDEELAPIK